MRDMSIVHQLISFFLLSPLSLSISFILLCDSVAAGPLNFQDWFHAHLKTQDPSLDYKQALATGTMASNAAYIPTPAVIEAYSVYIRDFSEDSSQSVISSQAAAHVHVAANLAKLMAEGEKYFGFSQEAKAEASNPDLRQLVRTQIYTQRSHASSEQSFVLQLISCVSIVCSLFVHCTVHEKSGRMGQNSSADGAGEFCSRQLL